VADERRGERVAARGLRSPTGAVARAAHLLVIPMVGLAALLVGCDARDQVPGAAATAARAAATPIPPPSRVFPTSTPAIGSAPTRSVPVARGTDSRASLSEQGIADVQRRLEHIIATSELAGIEDLLLDQVAISSPDGSEQLGRDQAAVWLRRRAGPGLHLTQFERHHHAALLVAQTEGWAGTPPIVIGRVGFAFHLYDPSGRQDDERGRWKIDVVTVE
jgi:hypothetical protein